MSRICQYFIQQNIKGKKKNGFNYGCILLCNVIIKTEKILKYKQCEYLLHFISCLYSLKYSLFSFTFVTCFTFLQLMYLVDNQFTQLLSFCLDLLIVKFFNQKQKNVILDSKYAFIVSYALYSVIMQLNCGIYLSSKKF